MSCSKVLVKISGWVPIFIVWILFAWASYTFIVEICIYMVSNVVEKVIYLILFLFFLFMSLWSYIKVTFTETAKVPYQFFLTNIETNILLEDKSEKNEILEAKALKLRVQGRTMTGGIRFCEICKCVKPDRAHHCSTCKRCILKMDHHCPWINNCVCYNNYKFFFLFLFYSSLLCIFITISSTQYFIKFWQLLYMNSSKAKRDLPGLSVKKDASSFSFASSTTENASVLISHLNIVLFFIFSVGLAVTITPLMGFHFRIACANLTTLESMRAPIFRSGPDKNAYNKGALKNLVEVFGSNLFLAFVPISTEIGDGITFIPRISPVPAGYRSLDSTNESNNQRLITSSAAMTPHILTEVVAVQPQIEE